MIGTERLQMIPDSRLIIYDTTNFTDFPIGGQLTSVRNFLAYLCAEHAERMRDVILVGVTKDPMQKGKWQKLSIDGIEVHFFAAAVVETNLGHTAHSLRLRYAKGLLHYGRMLNLTRRDCNYIQTPEAMGPLWLLQPHGQFVVFSHGSFFNMDKGFRFFRNRPAIRNLFTAYLKWVVRKADLIFILDEDSRRDYSPYTDRMEKPGNSIVLPGQYESWQSHDFAGRWLFVGRLSAGKRVADIIRAIALTQNGECLTIVGDGEERDHLQELAEQLKVADRVHFTYAVLPEQVSTYMDQSDLLIMNSDFEGVPMTILEAFSHGLPVVTTAVGGIGETVHFGEDALETDASPEAIAAAARRIEQDYHRFAQNAHHHAADFDYRIINCKIYDSLKHFWKDKQIWKKN